MSRAIVTNAKLNQYSPYTGVTYNATHKKFQSCITDNRKQIYLGRHTYSSDAALAYDNKAREIKPLNWRLNFLSTEEYEEAFAKESLGFATPVSTYGERKRGSTASKTPISKKRIRLSNLLIIEVSDSSQSSSSNSSLSSSSNCTTWDSLYCEEDEEEIADAV